MADSQSKIDAAAEKAYADAAQKKNAENVSVKAVEKAVEADKTAPAKAETVAKAVAAPASSPAKKPVARKAAPKKAAAKKKTSPAKKTTRKAAAKKPAARSNLKDTIMTKTKTQTETITKTVKEAAADAQTRLKTAYGKGAEMTADVTAFHKANIEALVASGKILASGMQDMGRTYVEDAKAAAETVTEDVKKMAAIKSPTELFQLQGEIVRRNFDAAVAQTSKSAEMMTKLANDMFAPLSTRASQAAEKFSKAA